MKKVSSLISVALIMLVLTSFTSIKSFASTSNIISFEENVPENWTTASGKLSISNKHFKHQQESLQWEWITGDKIVLTDDATMTEAGKNKGGGIVAWVYNENPIKDKLTLNFGTKAQISENNPLYTFDFNLDFKGWRALWVSFRSDAINTNFIGKRTGDIEQMEILAPTEVESGNLYFDLVEFVTRIPSIRAQDYQVPIKRSTGDGLGTWESTYHYSTIKPHLPLEELTEEDLNSFNKIEKKLDEWIYGTDKYKTTSEMKSRINTLNKYISNGKKAYDSLNIKKDSEGNLTGVPLFAGASPYLKTGKSFGRDVASSIFLPLAFDYKINGNMDSYNKLMDLFDYNYDQGWAEGSAIGTLDHETLRSSGYFASVYIMRDELESTDRLERERNSIYWYSHFGKVYVNSKTNYEESTADEMRTHFINRLFYIMTMEDSPKKVLAMKSYLEWANGALRVNSGHLGVIKPDYTGFHHRSIYMNAYAPHGYHLASAVNYILDDTKFELNTDSKYNLKQALITLDKMTNTAEIPFQLRGRFPHQNSQIGLEILPSFAYMAMSGDDSTGETIDREMAGIFNKIWTKCKSRLNSDIIGYGYAGISFVNTLGGLETMLDVVNSNIEPSKEEEGFWSKPYGGLAIHRRENWMALSKGWSKYMWDFESGGKSKDNVYGRYMSYGTTLLLSKGEPISDIANGYDYRNGWDWNRMPGATTKHLSLKDLASSNKNYTHRNYSDQAFLGSVSSNNKEGIWGMSLHDTVYDPTFYAKKSVFFFDDELLFLGSNINNSDTQNNTETTLFQSSISKNPNIPIYINSNEPISSNPYNAKFKDSDSVWMLDPYENGYYIPSGRGLNVVRETQKSRDGNDQKDTVGEYATAWINHGTSPQDDGYEYVIKVDTTPDEMDKYSKSVPYTVLQKDANAHIVKNTTSNSIGYVIFEANSLLPQNELLLSTDTPILAMAKKVNDEIILSISDPDLRISPSANDASKTSEMKTTTITLLGKWALKDENSSMRVVDIKENQTIIEVDCIEGKTIESNLISIK